MEFRLTYAGKLKSKSNATRHDIHAIRREFHPQLKLLWERGALRGWKGMVGDPKDLPKGDISLWENVGGITFAAVVSDRWKVYADLDVLFLRPSPPGQLFNHGGDLDNRIKTLMDALRIPAPSEIPKGFAPTSAEIPFHCLLKDDALVSALSIRTDHLLKDVGKNDVQLVIQVGLKATGPSWVTIGI